MNSVAGVVLPESCGARVTWAVELYLSHTDCRLIVGSVDYALICSLYTSNTPGFSQHLGHLHSALAYTQDNLGFIGISLPPNQWKNDFFEMKRCT
jgi:hypothetical protein